MSAQVCKFCGDPIPEDFPQHTRRLYCSVDCRHRSHRQAEYERRQAEKAAQAARERLALVTDGTK